MTIALGFEPPLLPLQGLHILLCEDCADQGRILLTVLQKLGAEVTLECNGIAAVAAVSKSPAQFDAVLMDFQMPEMDGVIATQKLREIGYGGPIIAVTAHSSYKLRRAWFQAGCSEFLVKPVDVQQILTALEQHQPAAMSHARV